MPTRVDMQPKSEERTIFNSQSLILRDSINILNAEFTVRTPSLNGVHIYSRINNDFSIIGGLNNLLPIIVLMINNSELLTKGNFKLIITLISNYVFSSLYQHAIMKENDSNFFMSLGYFLEKIPDSFFNNDLIANFKLISSFLNSGDEKDFLELNKQFHNNILMNEKILFKFNEEDQKNLINLICSTAGKRNIDVDLVKIIKIMLNYDRKKNFKFCCKTHAYYFNDNYPIMDSELFNRIQPLEKLIEIILEKIYKLNKEKLKNYNDNIINTHNKSHSNKNLIITDENIYCENNLYLLFYLLTFDISPCLQKSIICLLTNIIKKYSYEIFVKIFDKKEELFDIVLFVFKSSIFDVKIHALNLLFLIEQNNKEKNLEDNDKKIFFKNEILPFFLLEEINNLPRNTEEQKKSEEQKNENNIQSESSKVEEKVKVETIEEEKKIMLRTKMKKKKRK